MLGSQCSASTSRTSLFSNDGESDVDGFRLPEKYRESCCLARKIFLDRESSYVDLVITDKCEIIECQLGEVVNYLKFSDEIKSTVPKFENFDVLICDDGRIIYAVKFNSTLIGLERKTSQLEILKTFSNVQSFKKHFDSVNNEIGFLLTFLDVTQKFTTFLDDDYENFLNNRNSEVFSSIFKNVHAKREAAERYLLTLTKEIEELRLKKIAQVPKNFLTDVS